MKRRKQIIFYVISIFVIILSMLSFTYAYNLININGNTTDKSIEVITSNSIIIYTDLSKTQNRLIEPGFVNIKLFTVKNIGNNSAMYHIYLDEVENNFVRTQDIRYTLYRNTGDNTINTKNLSSYDKVAEGQFPTYNTYIKLNEELSNPNDVYTYALKIEYLNSETENQDIDDNHFFSGLVQIKGDVINPFEEDTLAYEIFNNAKSGTNGTTFNPNLLSTGMVDNVTTASDKILSIADDDLGTSYYFRGNPIDNYVNFSGMCWRIVRIQGDGSIKLVLASEKTCSTTNLTTNSGYATDGAAGTQGEILWANYGYKIVGSYYINDYINSAADTTGNARTKLNAWLERKITSESDKALLKNETWCIGDQTNAYSYDDTGEVVGTVSDLINSGTSFKFTAGNKYFVTKTPSYKCETTGVDGEIDINKVGMLTFDEIVYAGGGNSTNSNYYLNNDATTINWWTLSPRSFNGGDYCSNSFFVADVGIVFDWGVVNDFALRPTVSLKSNIPIQSGGDGTIGSPYVVN